MQLVENNDLILVSLAGQIPRIRQLLADYADIPMDFADACVVRMAELHPESSVCTTDGHFKFYRKQERENISLLAPFAS